MLDHMPVDLARRRFTVDEYQRMGEAGVFSENDRVELIDGEILTMSPIGSPHAAAIARATRALILMTGTRCIVRAQLPVRLERFSEPEPDFILARPRDDFYQAGHPQPADVLLVIEIADSSLRYDRDIKMPLYARNDIVEYWLVDLASHTLTRYAAPGGGTYREVSVHERGQVLSPASLPDCAIPVDELLVEPRN